MNYHNITKDDMLNGEGIRVVLWVAGCIHNCPSCHNPITHDVDGGIDFDEAAKEELFFELKKDYVEGITLSGGDPLHEKNRDTILNLCMEIKEKFPNKNIWLYTGYTYDQIKDLDILNYIDILCDGRFVLNLANVSNPWVGSTNQRVIDVNKTKSVGNIVLKDKR